MSILVEQSSNTQSIKDFGYILSCKATSKQTKNKKSITDQSLLDSDYEYRRVFLPGDDNRNATISCTNSSFNFCSHTPSS